MTPGTTANLELIQDSAAVFFSVNDHNAIVDWVFVELRSKEIHRDHWSKSGFAATRW